MLKIGITGGIGSGKSTVSKIFEVLGIPVYYADIEAKRIMNTNPKIINAIKEVFGTSSYLSGKLNREWIAKCIFDDAEKRNQLNQIVHPETIADAERWMNAQTSPYALKEAALIFESHAASKLDFVIGVYSNEKIRLERIVKRDQITIEDALLRIKGQMDEAEKMSKCDFIIDNNETDFLIEQVLKIHHLLLNKTNHPS